MAGRWMAVLATSAFLAVGCGGGASNGATSGGSTTGGGSTGGGSGGNTTISIASLTFSPQNVTVASPSTITVVNNDSMSHTATSEAAAGAYVVGKAAGGFQFDTGNISANGGSATISVPSGLASGSVQPYFCAVHKGFMKDPDPTITIK